MSLGSRIGLGILFLVVAMVGCFFFALMKIANLDPNQATSAEARLGLLTVQQQLGGVRALLQTGLFTTLILGLGLAAWVSFRLTRPIQGEIQNLLGTAGHFLNSAEDVAGASRQLSKGAGDQASSLEETSASLEEMSSATKQNASNARQANAMATNARDAAEVGRGAIERMSDAIERIKASSDQTARVIKTIDEIAFQTNLLALNAAVEAARAGDAGKGFAVVAEEVRNLAMRSADAARQTAALIEEAQRNAENGVAVSKDVGASLDSIFELAGKLSEIVAEVSAASDEQASGIATINEAVGRIDQVTQSNAGIADRCTSSSSELTTRAKDLATSMQRLSTLVSGAESYVPARSMPSTHQQASSIPSGSANTLQRPALTTPPPTRTAPKLKLLERKPETQRPTADPKLPLRKVANMAPEQVIPLDDDELSSF